MKKLLETHLDSALIPTILIAAFRTSPVGVTALLQDRLHPITDHHHAEVQGVSMNFLLTHQKFAEKVFLFQVFPILIFPALKILRFPAARILNQ
ncbi:MAG: hypothetical protein CM1200mP30_31380 [Pseudomonadota bacterium]|nr:MAG: hypothetical protein CM1200mP30_31380 [Pseudomonadota bacterium]